MELDVSVEVRQTLTGYADAVMAELKRVVRRNALRLEREAKLGAPVDTGALRNSIQTNTSKVNTELEATVSTGVEYAVHVEYGTRKSRPQPFMRPAIEKVAPQFVEECQEALNR